MYFLNNIYKIYTQEKVDKLAMHEPNKELLCFKSCLHGNLATTSGFVLCVAVCRV